jgi:TolB-like protein
LWAANEPSHLTGSRTPRRHSIRLLEGADQRPCTTVALPDKPSIAVLPFTNLSGDPDQQYFGDGIAEDILTDLVKLRWLFVISRNSSVTFRGKAVDVRNVSRELGVRYVLEGSVRRAGNRIRVTGQLIEATTGAHVWASRFDRDLADIFTVRTPSRMARQPELALTNRSISTAVLLPACA